MSGTTTNVRWPRGGLGADPLPRPLEVGRACGCPVRIGDPAGRRRPQVGDVEVGVEHLAERPRDRRRGHEQDVRRAAAGLRLERAALLDAEAVLLVDDDQPEVGERHRLLDAARGCRRRPAPGPMRDAPRSALARVGLERAGQQRHADPELGSSSAPTRLEVLAREQVGRREQGALAARRAPRPPARRRRPRSCPSRRRPGAAGASASAGRGPSRMASIAASWSSVSSTARPTSRDRARRRGPPGSAASDASSIATGDAAARGPRCRRRATIPSWSASSSSKASRRERGVAVLERRPGSGPPRARSTIGTRCFAARIVGRQVLRVGAAGSVERLADGRRAGAPR